MTDPAPELKPCPFCGSEPKRQKSVGRLIECRNKHCPLCAIPFGFMQWNTRANDHLAETNWKMVEALEKISLQAMQNDTEWCQDIADQALAAAKGVK